MQVGYLTDVGRVRPINEDCLWADPELLVLADGMGGHQAGEVASRLAVESVVAHFHDHQFSTSDGQLDSALDRVRASIRAANRLIYQKGLEDPRFRGMGTTLTLALIKGGEAIIGHVGDSRAYLVQKDSLVQLTEDHSVVWELMRKGSLSRQEARVHPYRNMLTRALGTSSAVEVDALKLSLKPTDGLLLCSDGLTSVLSDEEIHAIIIANFGHPQAAVDELIRQANARGAPDNVSAILALPEGVERG